MAVMTKGDYEWILNTFEVLSDLLQTEVRSHLRGPEAEQLEDAIDANAVRFRTLLQPELDAAPEASE